MKSIEASTICTSIVQARWSGRGPRGERLRGHPAVAGLAVPPSRDRCP
jgi:hypothetical protein